MSESSFPFQGQAAVADGAAPEQTESRSNKAMLVVLAAVAAAVVLAAVAYLLFFSGGDDGVDDAAVVSPPSVVAPVVPAVPEPAVVVPVVKQRISAKSFGRDPFEARIVEAPVAVEVPVVTAAVAPAAPALPTAPTVTPTDTGSTDSDVTAPTTDAPLSSEPHRFRVVEVAPDNGSIDVNVDGKMFNNLTAGEVFCTYFKVVLISGSVNSFQFGEEKFNVIGTKRLTIA